MSVCVAVCCPLPEKGKAVYSGMGYCLKKPTYHCFLTSDKNSESSSFAPFLFAHFCSPLTLKEPNYRNEVTKQLKLTPDLLSPECTPCLA